MTMSRRFLFLAALLLGGRCAHAESILIGSPNVPTNPPAASYCPLALGSGLADLSLPVDSGLSSSILILPGSKGRTLETPVSKTAAPARQAVSSEQLLADEGKAVEFRPSLEGNRSAALADEVGRLSAAASRARSALAKSVQLGRWNGQNTSLSGSCCGDAAPKLGFLLRQMGFPADVVYSEFHYYLMERTADGDIVVDPTFRQFFGGLQAPPEIPEIFVGTVEDLAAFFKAHSARKTTQYELQRIYFSGAVIRNERIEAIRTGVEKSHAIALPRIIMPGEGETAPEPEEFLPIIRFLRQGEKTAFAAPAQKANPWRDISPEFDGKGKFRALIEIPKGSKEKYELDKKTGLLKLDRVIDYREGYPADYGFIPQSYADDGDPLDVLVLGRRPLGPLALVRVQAIGVVRMVDQGKGDDKIIAVLADDPVFGKYRDLQDLPPGMVEHIRRFFREYKDSEGKKVKVGAAQGFEAARAIIARALEDYRALLRRLLNDGGISPYRTSQEAASVGDSVPSSVAVTATRRG
ncbi:MAG: inorganic diphosphatase [Elusimicrobiota bacterium]|jgi:inorganic pyrophosphatase